MVAFWARLKNVNGGNLVVTQSKDSHLKPKHPLIQAVHVQELTELALPVNTPDRPSSKFHR